MSNYNSNSKITSWALAGLAAGGALWYLLGTEKGKSLMSNLSDQAKDISDKVKPIVGMISRAKFLMLQAAYLIKQATYQTTLEIRQTITVNTAQNYRANLQQAFRRKEA